MQHGHAVRARPRTRMRRVAPRGVGVEGDARGIRTVLVERLDHGDEQGAEPRFESRVAEQEADDTAHRSFSPPPAPRAPGRRGALGRGRPGMRGERGQLVRGRRGGAAVALDVGRHVSRDPQVGIDPGRPDHGGEGDHAGPDVEFVVLGLVEREPGAHLGRGLAQGEAQQHGAPQLLLRRWPGVPAAARDDVVDHEVEPSTLLVEIPHLRGRADDHDGAVVDVGVVGRPGDDQPVDERDRHADFDGLGPGPPEEAAGGGAVQVHDVAVPPVGERDHHGVAAVRTHADVADQSFVQDGVDGRAVVDGAVGIAVQRRALRGRAAPVARLSRHCARLRARLRVGHACVGLTPSSVPDRSIALPNGSARDTTRGEGTPHRHHYDDSMLPVKKHCPISGNTWFVGPAGSVKCRSQACFLLARACRC